MNKCGKCGKEYETYPVLLCDNPCCFVNYMAVREQYGQLCPECFKEALNG